MRAGACGHRAAQKLLGFQGVEGCELGLFICPRSRSLDRSRSFSYRHPLPQELPGPKHCPSPEGRVIPSAPPWPGLPEPRGEQGSGGRPGSPGMSTHPKPSHLCVGLWIWGCCKPDSAVSCLAATGTVPFLQLEEALDWLVEQI